MLSVQSIAASGLRAQSTRLAVSAHDVANVNTDGHQAQRTVLEAQPQGGVSARVEPEGGPPPLAVRDGAEVMLSTTDISTEAVEQISAQRAFEANIAVLRAADDMDESLLDLVG